MSADMLLDSSALIALALIRHEHHEAAQRYVGASGFATCPITEGALVRTVVRAPGTTAADALTLLISLERTKRCTFWPDSISYREVPMAGISGHKQVTDAYLAQLARQRNVRLATLDRAQAEAHPDVADLVPTS